MSDFSPLFERRPPRGRPAAEHLREWRLLPVYERFEQAVVFALSVVIAVVVIAAVFELAREVFVSLVLERTLDPTDPAVFRSIFGLILTVIIALEFKRSILVVAERRFGVVQARAVVLIALLAVVRKVIVLDLETTSPAELAAVAAAAIALGGVYWLVRDQDRKEAADAEQGVATARSRPARAAPPRAPLRPALKGARATRSPVTSGDLG